MRFALIGLGAAARELHVPAIRSLPGATLTGGADASGEARRAWTAATGTPAFGDAASLLEDARPDVVVVGTPPDSHATYCLQALQAGAHVICEKPFVMDLEQADAVLEAARRTGRQVAVNMQFRVMPIFAGLLRRLGAPDVGRLAFAQLWQLMPGQPHAPQSWRGVLGGGTLFEAGVHLVDLLCALFGEQPGAVYARTSGGFDDRHGLDPVHVAVFEFSQGRLGQVMLDRLCPSGIRYLELRADCERASLRASLGGRALVRLGVKRAERPGLVVELGLGGVAWIERGAVRSPFARNPRNPLAAATASLFRGTVSAFVEGREAPTPARQARDTLACILACYESARTGVRVEVAGGVERETRRA